MFELFDQAGASGGMIHINEASEMLDYLSKLEYETIGLLEELGKHTYL